MKDLTNSLIKIALQNDIELSDAKRAALEHFLENGVIKFVELRQGPLLVTAKAAAELLGVSTDTFKKIRVRAAELGIDELCGEEITPGTIMYSRLALLRFAIGDYRSRWQPPSQESEGHAATFNAIADASVAVMTMEAGG